MGPGNTLVRRLNRACLTIGAHWSGISVPFDLGTDWPHTDIFAPGAMPNDGDLMNRLIDFAPDPATRNQILADNPATLFDSRVESRTAHASSAFRSC
jgi:hypothetical protein